MRISSDSIRRRYGRVETECRPSICLNSKIAMAEGRFGRLQLLYIYYRPPSREMIMVSPADECTE